MRIIKIWEKEIKLNIGEELTVRELRKVFPIVEKYSNNDVELVVQVIIALSDEKDVEEVVDSMNREEFNELNIKISELLDTQKK